MKKLKLVATVIAMALPLTVGAADTTYRVANLDARASFDNRTINDGTLGDLQVVRMPNFTSDSGCTQPKLDSTEMARDMNDRISGSSAKYGELATRNHCSEDDEERKWVIRTGADAANATSVTLKVTLANDIGNGNIKMELIKRGEVISNYNCSGGQSSSQCEFSDGITATITMKSSDGTLDFDTIKFSGDSGDFNNNDFYEDVIDLEIKVDDHVTNIGYHANAS